MLAMIGALLTITLGLLGALAPRRVSKVVGIEPIGGLGVSEVRATYGGLFIAMGGTCLMVNSSQVYFVAAAAWLGAAAMRIPSLIVDRGSYPKAIVGGVIESTIALLLATGAA